MQWMCAIMSCPWGFSERIQLRWPGLIAFPNINHSTSCQDVSLGELSSDSSSHTVKLLSSMLLNGWIMYMLYSCYTTNTSNTVIIILQSIIMNYNVSASKCVPEICTLKHTLPGSSLLGIFEYIYSKSIVSLVAECHVHKQCNILTVQFWQMWQSSLLVAACTLCVCILFGSMCDDRLSDVPRF